ncbi:MAG TPA: cellulase family glycosylhydrolase [Anaeromyxobacteraceae bacterium]|jgi:hypothetical protein|nr:cellulase family glycosylhydrolase [Anaeromyxobacteraceae bacterium]
MSGAPFSLLLAAALAASSAAPAGQGRGPSPLEAAAVNRIAEVQVATPATGAHAEIVTPSGATYRLPAFPLAGGAAVRFRPREPGLHRWRLLAADGPAARELARGEVMAEDVGASGQVLARGGRLETEDGRPFHPLGENRFNVYDPAWSDGLSPEAYLARMADYGMNTVRVFVFTACGRAGAPAKPGCLEPALGRFDEPAAARYDEIFSAAERHGLKVVLSIFAIGFTPGDQWKGWEENPYASVRGGPAASPAAFFSSAAAREAARRRLRYVLGRWAASPALLSVDLLNEPEWDGTVDEDLWIPWAQDLARTWRSEDPYQHPITLGPVGLHWNVKRDERAWWASDACDIVQWHRYGKDVYDVHDLAAALVSTVRDTARYGKPVLLGEFAWGGEAKPAYDHTHVGLWATTFAGAGVLAHSAPVFAIDSDEPMTPERGRHFRVLAAFLRRAEARGPLAPAPDPEASVPGLRALALAGPSTVALWLHGPRAGYGGTVRGASVALRGLAPGRWRITWLDDASGAELAVEERALGEDPRLTAPPFARHVAALLERAGDDAPRSRR